MEQHKELLNRERDETLAEIKRLEEYLKYEVRESSEEGSPDIHEREKTLGMIEDMKRKLSLIDHALYKIEDGTYGVCEDCGQDIDPARLEVLPYATLCIKCKERAERR